MSIIEKIITATIAAIIIGILLFGAISAERTYSFGKKCHEAGGVAIRGTLGNQCVRMEVIKP